MNYSGYWVLKGTWLIGNPLNSFYKKNTVSKLITPSAHEMNSNSKIQAEGWYMRIILVHGEFFEFLSLGGWVETPDNLLVGNVLGPLFFNILTLFKLELISNMIRLHHSLIFDCMYLSFWQRQCSASLITFTAKNSSPTIQKNLFKLRIMVKQ